MQLKLRARARLNLNVRRLCSRRATREIPTSRPAIAARLPEEGSLNKAGAYHRQRTGNLADRGRPDACCSTLPLRSEERRVGKECRSGGSAAREKKKRAGGGGR